MYELMAKDNQQVNSNQEPDGIKTSETTRLPSEQKPLRFEDPLYGANIAFEDFLGKRLDTPNRKQAEIREIQDILDAHGLGHIVATGVPPYFVNRSREFTDQDWQYIQATPKEQQLLAIYTVINAPENEWSSSGFPRRHEPWGQDFYQANPRAVGELATLPLVYQTSMETLRKIIANGRILSDRALHHRLISEGKSTEAISDSALFSTHTYADDRRAGLDNFVFTHFGRPFTDAYGDVEILLKPDRFYSDTRAFATKHDLLYFETGTGIREDSYRAEVIQGTGGYFLRSAARKLKQITGRETVMSDFLYGGTNQNPQHLGKNFNGWEVKVPEFTVADIDSIVFTSADKLNEFKKSFGDTIPLKLRASAKKLRTVVNGKLGEGAAMAYSDQQLYGWSLEYYKKHPEEKEADFGTADIELDKEKIYTLTDADRRYKAAMQTELERDSNERLARLREREPSERRECYVAISFPQQHITSQSDIYRMNAGRIFADLSAVQAEFAERESRAKRIKFRLIPGKIPVRLQVVKLETLNSEYESSIASQHIEGKGRKRMITYRIIDSLSLSADV